MKHQHQQFLEGLAHPHHNFTSHSTSHRLNYTNGSKAPEVLDTNQTSTSSSVSQTPFESKHTFKTKNNPPQFFQGQKTTNKSPQFTPIQPRPFVCLKEIQSQITSTQLKQHNQKLIQPQMNQPQNVLNMYQPNNTTKQNQPLNVNQPQPFVQNHFFQPQNTSQYGFNFNQNPVPAGFNNSTVNQLQNININNQSPQYFNYNQPQVNTQFLTTNPTNLSPVQPHFNATQTQQLFSNNQHQQFFNSNQPQTLLTFMQPQTSSPNQMITNHSLSSINQPQLSVTNVPKPILNNAQPQHLLTVIQPEPQQLINQQQKIVINQTYQSLAQRQQVNLNQQQQFLTVVQSQLNQQRQQYFNLMQNSNNQILQTQQTTSQPQQILNFIQPNQQNQQPLVNIIQPQQIQNQPQMTLTYQPKQIQNPKPAPMKTQAQYQLFNTNQPGLMMNIMKNVQQQVSPSQPQTKTFQPQNPPPSTLKSIESKSTVDQYDKNLNVDDVKTNATYPQNEVIIKTEKTDDEQLPSEQMPKPPKLIPISKLRHDIDNASPLPSNNQELPQPPPLYPAPKEDEFVDINQFMKFDSNQPKYAESIEVKDEPREENNDDSSYLGDWANVYVKEEHLEQDEKIIEHDWEEEEEYVDSERNISEEEEESDELNFTRKKNKNRIIFSEDEEDEEAREDIELATVNKDVSNNTESAEQNGGKKTTNNEIENPKEETSKSTMEKTSKYNSDSDFEPTPPMIKKKTKQPKKKNAKGSENRIQKRRKVVTDDKEDDFACSDNVFSCKECNYKTTWKGNMRKHKMSRHTSQDKINWQQCTKCSYRGKTVDYLRWHMKSKHTENEDVLSCPECDYTTLTKATLRNHVIALHTDTSKINWKKCEQCDFRTKFRRNLVNHCRNVHDETVHWFNCPQCAYKGKDNAAVKRHYANLHLPKKKTVPFQCPYCPKSFKIKYSLKEHVKYVHKSKVPDKQSFIIKDVAVVIKGKLCWRKAQVIEKSAGNDGYFCAQCQFYTATKEGIADHARKIHNILRDDCNNKKLVLVDLLGL